MFLGSDNGGRTAAVLSSLIATAKRLGLDPFAYLRDLFGRICSHPQNRLASISTGLEIANATSNLLPHKLSRCI
jgi:hypothetical protein